ncbi:MAG: penicillin-binding transpeptidase domain-containing protein, partial [Pseudomonadota bacterium]
LQRHAERTISRFLTDNGEAFNISQGATVIMTPEGFVRAMVGGRDYGESQFNRATDALRSPGSTFKGFVYATAMESGFTPRSVVRDAPVYIGNWSPKNYSLSYSGPVTLTQALVRSINTVPVRLMHHPKVGRSKVIETTRAMGVTSELRNDPTLAIGTSEINVLEMTTGYAVFANGGYRAYPKPFLKILNSRGEVIIDQTEGFERPRVLSEDAVASMNEILAQVPEWGTGRRAKLDDRRTAGKTGTTQSYRDAWFVGYTGNYVAAVWYGNDNYEPTNRLTGGRLPAMTWKELMTFAHSGIESRPIPFLDEKGQADLTVARVDEEDDGTNAATIADPKVLSPRSTEILNGLGTLLKTRNGSFDTALAPLRGNLASEERTASSN